MVRLPATDVESTEIDQPIEDEEGMLPAQLAEHQSEWLQEYLTDTREDEEHDIPKCVICFEERRRKCVLLDCGHANCCLECGQTLKRDSAPCPTCRAPIRMVTRIFY